MEEEPHLVPELIHISEGMKCTSLSFFGQMCNIVQPDKDQFIVKEIKWYKECGSKRHEFLIAQLQRIQGTHVQFAVVE